MKFISEMFRGRSGKINSKIVLGFLAFVVSVVYGFMDKELGVIIAFLTFSSTGLGWSAFDNKSAIQIQKTETVTKNKDTKTEINVAQAIKEIKKGNSIK